MVLVNETRKGLAYARNRGITISQGEIIIATDDDVKLPPTWLERLVAPRLAATTITLPLLAVCSDVVGFFGGMLVANLQWGVSPELYYRGVYDFVTIGDFVSGIGKTVVFGVVIGTIACSFGMRVQGGTEGVGRATTRAVVWSALSVLLADALLTKLLLT